MAHTDKNIVITPAVGDSSNDPRIQFSGANSSVAAQTITLRMLPDNSGTLLFEGSAGQLFSVVNSTSGTVYAVNDAAGVPIIRAVDSGSVSISPYAGSVVIGSPVWDSTSKLYVNGTLGIHTQSRKVTALSGATGTVIHNFNLGSTWYHSSIAANFTVDLTNVPVTDNRSIPVVLWLNQGATGYYPSAININGSAATLRWLNNTIPTPGTNRMELVEFELLRTAATWYVLAQYTVYA